MNQTIQERQAIERRIVERVIDAMLAAGYSLGVNDGEETTVKRSKDKATILGAMFTVDEEELLVYNTERRIGWVFFVYGNEPGWDVICDHSTNLSSILDPIAEWIDQQESPEPPKRIRCDQCEALMINGVFCHETGCPNTKARYDSENGEWIKTRECFDCGYRVDADDPCCSAPMEE